MQRIRVLTLLPLLLAACAGGSKEATEAEQGTPAEPEAVRRGYADSYEAGSDFDVEIAQAAGIGDELLILERGDVPGATRADEPLGGELRAKVDGAGTEVPLPLEHTDVKGRLTLNVGTVRVQQTFHNPYEGKIEAVYVFPLPQSAAVSDFLMKIGERTIRGIIREREEAQRIYEEAKRQGYTASLLRQERPNIFTQAVANIEPGKSIDIEILYFQTLHYEEGQYEFVFPMVVGPRFNPPGSTDGVGAVGRGQSGSSGQATEVTYLRPGEFSSHLVSLALDVDPGCEVGEMESPSHQVEIEWKDKRHAHVTLAGADRIPNRDFVLRYRVAQEKAYGSAAVHRTEEGGYFTLILQPPATVDDLPALPREMVFVVDCSGSMEGEPLAACKRAIRRCLKRLRPNDTLQVIRFSERASTMGDKPVPASPENVRRALRYVEGLRADGGTMMITGIRAALGMSDDAERRRIVSFMTDGYIGNEHDILAEVHDRIGNARIFSFGVGNSVNRYLLERMAAIGRGAAAYVGTDESSERAVDLLYRRIEQPAMTDLEIDWGRLQVSDVFPSGLSDLIVGSPVVLSGRFRGAGRAKVRVKGQVAGHSQVIEVPLDLESGESNDAIAKVWARAKIASLHDRMTWDREARDSIVAEIRDLGLTHNLVTDFTSFVAVDSSRRTEGDHGTTVPVAVPVPAGTRYETTVK